MLDGHENIGSNRNLVNACKLFYDQWLPVGNEVLSQIREGLSTGAYELDPDFFFDTLKADIGLFCYFLREARRYIQEKNGDDTPLNLNPKDLYQELELDQLCSIFDVTVDQISPHKYHSESDVRVSQTKAMIINATTTELLVKEEDGDSITGFSVGSLSQIGKALIAWNYPEIYKESVIKCDTEDELENLLTIRLGFSPKLLVVALARDFGLSSDIRSALGDSFSLLESDSSVAVTNKLKEFCEIGAIVAAANTPELYRPKQSDWQKAINIVESMLGSEGLKQIHDQIQACLKTYPLAVNIKNELNHIPKIAPELISNGFIKNRNRNTLPKIAQNELQLLYNKIDQQLISKADGIRELMRNISPLAGFPRGCIYILDPSASTLTPRLTIGKHMQDAYRPVYARSINTRNINPIGSAYNCSAPVIFNDYSLSSIGNICIAGLISRKQRVGVLYLEPQEDIAYSPDSNLLYRFKSILLAIEYVLGVE